MESAYSRKKRTPKDFLKTHKGSRKKNSQDPPFKKISRTRTLNKHFGILIVLGFSRTYKDCVYITVKEPF